MYPASPAFAVDALPPPSHDPLDQREEGGTTMSTRDYQKQADQAKRDAERAKEDVKRAAERGGEAARGMAHDAKQSLEEGASKVASTLHDASDAIETRGREMAHTVKEQIESKPMTSTLTALGIGVFLGWILARRG
jgi:ElaB/YqjD/DUF883 family membrane-anchored ribosome-binding protein